MMVIGVLRRVLSCFFTRFRGSYVVEGVLVLPVVIMVVVFVVGVFNYVFVSSLIRHRVDSFGSFVSSVGGGEVVVEGVSLGLVSGVSGGVLELFLLEGGFLEGDRLVVDCVVEGGYLVVRVDYLVSFLFFGDVGVVEFYERRLW